jgi:xanthine/uracil permease
MKFNIIYFGLAVTLTAIFTAIACLRQIARKKQPSSGAAYGGAFSAAVIAVIFSIFYSAGASACSLDFWTNPALPGVRAYLLQWALTRLVCVVPAAFVAAKFQRKFRQ